MLCSVMFLPLTIKHNLKYKFNCVFIQLQTNILIINNSLIHIISIQQQMDKPLWRKIDKNNTKPCPRWGHTCCVIGEEIVFFGGYADSNYMNDLWTYNSITMKWEEIHTTGEKPSQRSNCSMNYDPQNNQIVIFGGGGPNKQRFNSISILDWNTKKWIQINPKQNQPAPWERTYHIAQLKFPYLAVFGGEGVADLDDLWIFNFKTLGWTEVKFEKDSVKPCARRFHSSCMINNQIFVVAGCHGKYRCLSDVYSVDLTPLIESGSLKQLKWVERKLKGSSFLTRWGHSSAVYDNKIYVFAGRFSNDLNDLLVIDVQNNSLKGLKISGNSQDHPKPRRRHCAGFVGSCMIAFGGFNGQYFNDLHYINVFELNSKIESFNQDETFKNYVNSQPLSDGVIQTSQGQSIYIHSCLIARYFQSYSDFINYLQEINRRYKKDELMQLLQSLYKGFSKYQQDEILIKYEIILPQTINRRFFVNPLIAEKESNARNMLKLAHQSNERTNQVVVSLKRSQFQCFLESRRSQWFTDASVSINKTEIRVNKTLLSMNNPYFCSLFSGSFLQNEQVQLSFSKDYSIVIDILLNYLMMNVVVVPNDFTTQAWMDLTELSQYFCIGSLKTICQSQLCSRVQAENTYQLQVFSDKLELNNLSLHCANYQLKNSLKSNQLKKKVVSLKQNEVRRSSFMKLYDTVKFDLYHNNWIEHKETNMKKLKSENETMMEQKENNREYNNA